MGMRIVVLSLMGMRIVVLSLMGMRIVVLSLMGMRIVVLSLMGMRIAVLSLMYTPLYSQSSDPSSKIPMEECQAYAVLAQQRSGSGKPDQYQTVQKKKNMCMSIWTLYENYSKSII